MVSNELIPKHLLIREHGCIHQVWKSHVLQQGRILSSIFFPLFFINPAIAIFIYFLECLYNEKMRIGNALSSAKQWNYVRAGKQSVPCQQ